MVKATECELQRDDGWDVVEITEALDIRARTSKRHWQSYLMRCCECHGRVQPHKQAKNGMAAHFEHATAHRGCGRSTEFSGSPSQHPEALM